MTIQFEVNAEIEARLIAGAKERGVPVEKYAQSLLQDAIALRSEQPGKLSVEELHTMLSGIAAGSEKLPQLPTTAFTRESLYEDRS